MAETNGGVFSGADEEMVRNLRSDFLDDTIESVSNLEAGIAEAQGGRNDANEVLMTARKLAFNVKGQAANFGLSLLTAVARRLNDYLANLSQLDDKGLDDLSAFTDTLGDVLDGRIKADASAASVVRDLPAKRGFETNEIETRNVEALLVMLHGAATHYVERELHECGYRVSHTASALDALDVIIHTKPDFVVISAVMPHLSGVDLATALATMPATRNTPVLLITSYERGHESLALLPDSVPIVRKGSSFGDDLADALSAKFLL